MSYFLQVWDGANWQEMYQNPTKQNVLTRAENLSRKHPLEHFVVRFMAYPPVSGVIVARFQGGKQVYEFVNHAMPSISVHSYKQHWDSKKPQWLELIHETCSMAYALKRVGSTTYKDKICQITVKKPDGVVEVLHYRGKEALPDEYVEEFWGEALEDYKRRSQSWFPTYTSAQGVPALSILQNLRDMDMASYADQMEGVCLDTNILLLYSKNMTSADRDKLVEFKGRLKQLITWLTT